MKNKIKIISKTTGEQVEFNNSRTFFSELYSPYMEQFLDYSTTFEDILKRYYNSPLVEYVLTDADKRRIEKNPDAINDIPRYYVPGYDRKVGEEFNGRLRCEFYARFKAGSKGIIQFINDTNTKYIACLAE